MQQHQRVPVAVVLVGHRDVAELDVHLGPPTVVTVPSLYEFAGGEAAIHHLEELFYASVLRDPLLVPLFGAGRPEHVRLTLAPGRATRTVSSSAPTSAVPAPPSRLSSPPSPPPARVPTHPHSPTPRRCHDVSRADPANGSWPRVLWVAGAALLVAMVVHLVAMVVLGGPVSGPVSLRKPATFAETGWLLCWSVAAVLPRLRTRPWQRHVIGGAVLAFAVVETAVMAVQAWRGVPSHYNFTTPLDAALVRGGAAGTAVVFVVGMVVLLGVAVRSRVSAAGVRLGVVGGVVVVLLGAATGMVMISTNSGCTGAGSAAGSVFPAPTSGPTPPLWARLRRLRPATAGGDLVLPHAVGVHGMLLLAVPAVLLAGKTLAARTRLALVATMGAAVGLGLAVLFVHALRMLPLDALGAAGLALLAGCAWRIWPRSVTRAVLRRGRAPGPRVIEVPIRTLNVSDATSLTFRPDKPGGVTRGARAPRGGRCRAGRARAWRAPRCRRPRGRGRCGTRASGASATARSAGPARAPPPEGGQRAVLDGGVEVAGDDGRAVRGHPPRRDELQLTGPAPDQPAHRGHRVRGQHADPAQRPAADLEPAVEPAVGHRGDVDVPERRGGEDRRPRAVGVARDVAVRPRRRGGAGAVAEVGDRGLSRRPRNRSPASGSTTRSGRSARRIAASAAVSARPCHTLATRTVSRTGPAGPRRSPAAGDHEPGDGRRAEGERAGPRGRSPRAGPR